MYHREMLLQDEEFWRNYIWETDYTITRKGKLSKLKVRRKLRRRVQLLKPYLKDYGYTIFLTVIGLRYITVWYAKL